ncbi:hypothetical protein GGR28_002317 [Lewinella aquimaris]|uniref:Tail sheath protein C-terminal domain-containing protein n=1 Tax=Neolewinella aquimaris TaxID=1835722 RepID=A0A840E7I2_9BACT|nr:phage tail sheath C-terminal domain-containing protein [Neolewinella aquimaris]MBB4079692.1 hypothetical protein [Neolewinella aquimaris]
MASTYKTPGVYVEEISIFPPSVAAVETAIPAFIGYTEKAKRREDGDLFNVPYRITSLKEYELYYGFAVPEAGITVNINTSVTPEEVLASITDRSNYLMYYSLQAFFDNGGGPCYITAVDSYANGAGVVDFATLQAGLNEVAKVDEVTLLVFPDSTNLSSAADYYALHKAALDQCADLQDRFTVMDVWLDPADPTANNIDTLRNTLAGTVDQLKYGAVYYPMVDTILDYAYDETAVTVTIDGTDAAMDTLPTTSNAQYNQAKAAINQIDLTLPVSAAVVGVYARVDETRGVWKAPANETIDLAIRPTIKISKQDQESLNVDVTGGKSINAIRAFAGRSPALIWGSRTLAGNDNEWRYVPVRRFFNMAEESIKKASEQFVFEPNDANTWVRVRGMIENFLTLQWRAGALAGAVPEDAFFVRVGLGTTMTALDILEGRMIVEIGLAVVRPAEFIILRFSHKMQES